MTSDSRAHAALRSFNRFRRDGVAVLAGLAGFTIRVCAADVGAPLQAPLKTIVVTSERPPVSVPDTEVKEQLEAAMRSDPFFTTNISLSRLRMGSSRCMGLFSTNGIFELQSASPGKFPV